MAIGRKVAELIWRWWKNWTDTSVKYVVWALSLQIRKQQYKAVILVPIYRVFRLNSKKVNLGGLRRVSEKNWWTIQCYKSKGVAMNCTCLTPVELDCIGNTWAQERCSKIHSRWRSVCKYNQPVCDFTIREYESTRVRESTSIVRTWTSKLLSQY